MLQQLEASIAPQLTNYMEHAAKISQCKMQKYSVRYRYLDLFS